MASNRQPVAELVRGVPLRPSLCLWSISLHDICILHWLQYLKEVIRQTVWHSIAVVQESRDEHLASWLRHLTTVISVLVESVADGMQNDILALMWSLSMKTPRSRTELTTLTIDFIILYIYIYKMSLMLCREPLHNTRVLLAFRRSRSWFIFNTSSSWRQRKNWSTATGTVTTGEERWPRFVRLYCCMDSGWQTVFQRVD